MRLKSKILWLGILAAVVRVVFIANFADLNANYYWEYGEIAKNLVDSKGYSLLYFKADSLDHRFDPTVSAYPSAYMPPGYVFFLVPFVMIKDGVLRNSLLLLVQLFLSILSISVLWKFTKNYFSERSALFAALLACLLPDFVFSVVSFTPTVLFHCGLIALLWMLYRSDASMTPAATVAIGVLASLLVFLRSEFLLFVVLLGVVFLFKRRVRIAAILLATLLVCVSPWILRNYQVFHEILPTTTSVGLNLYRGNNTLSIGSWGDEEVTAEIGRLPRDKNLELRLNRMYIDRAVKFMKDHPVTILVRWFQKAWDLWLINLHDPTGRSSNILQGFLSLLLFVLFLVGAAKSWSPGRHLHSYLFFGYSTLTAIAFFVMPRYQTMMRIAVLPFAGHGVEVLYAWFRMLFDERTTGGSPRSE